MRPTILVDIDDTITNHVNVWIKWLNRKFGVVINYEDISYWNYFNDLNRIYEIDKENIFYPHTQEAFWREIMIFPNATTALENWVKLGYQVYLVSNSSPTNEALGYKIQRTLDCFNENLINEDNVIIAKDKHMIYSDVIIDDKLDTVFRWYDFHKYDKSLGIIPKRPWNTYDLDISLMDFMAQNEEWKNIEKDVNTFFSKKWK